MRPLQLNVRLTPAERKRFERVAKFYGVSVANAVRLVMKLETTRITVQTQRPELA